MSLATRIKMSFIAIILFPLGMICLFLIAIGKYQIENIEEKYDIDVANTSMVFNRTYMSDLVTESIREKLYLAMEKSDFNPQQEDYWDKFNNDVSNEVVSIVVNYNDNYIYSGMDEEYGDITDMLPEYNSMSDISVATYYVEAGEKYLVKPVPFMHGDDNQTFGTVYIICQTKHALPEVKSLMIWFVIISVMLIVLTGCCLMIWLYKSVLRPINRLKDAAKSITKGNLDFSVTHPSADEFGELYDSFEEMRIHLKSSIEENLKNEKESKELISNISHDLKTPITAIKGYVEGIMDGVADTPEKLDRYIKTIYNKANDMDRLIGELTV